MQTTVPLLALAVGSFGDCARYRAAFILDKLDYRGVEAEFDALGFCVIAQDDFAVDDIGKAGEFGVGRLAGNMAGSPVFVQIISAVIVFVLVAYVLFVLGSFSFSKTIESVSPSVDVKVFEEKGGDGVEGSLEERCSRLAEDACLTEREREVFLLLAHGRNARYIQETLVVSYNTVKTHVSHVYAKLGVHSHQGLIDLVESKG